MRVESKKFDSQGTYEYAMHKIGSLEGVAVPMVLPKAITNNESEYQSGLDKTEHETDLFDLIKLGVCIDDCKR